MDFKYSKQQLKLNKLIDQKLHDIYKIMYHNKNNMKLIDRYNFEHKNFSYHNLSISPPKSALMKLSTVRKFQKLIQSGKNMSNIFIYIIEPQDYGYVGKLTAKNFMFTGDKTSETGLFYECGNVRKGVAVSGTGCDEWWLPNKSLLNYLTRFGRKLDNVIIKMKKWDAKNSKKIRSTKTQTKKKPKKKKKTIKKPTEKVRRRKRKKDKLY